MFIGSVHRFINMLLFVELLYLVPVDTIYMYVNLKAKFLLDIQTLCAFVKIISFPGEE